MQRDNRRTVASLTPQIRLPRPFSTCDLQGSARTTAQHTGGGGTGRAPANPKSLNGLCEPIWGVREATVPLFSVCMPLLCPYHDLIPSKRKLEVVIQAAHNAFVKHACHQNSNFSATKN